MHKIFNILTICYFKIEEKRPLYEKYLLLSRHFSNLFYIKKYICNGISLIVKGYAIFKLHKTMNK